MELKKNQRAYIFTRAKLGMRASEIHRELVTAYGESALCETTVSRWVNSFKAGKTSTDDEPRSGRPIIPEVDQVLLKTIGENPNLSTREIACITSIPKSTVYDRLVKLGWRCLHTKWVPHILSESQKTAQVSCAKEILSAMKACGKEGLIITGDESWLYFDNPPACEWVPQGGSPTKRAKARLTNRKLMVTVFFSAVGIETVDYLPEGKSVDSDYFCDVVLTTLKGKIETRRPGTGIAKTKLHVDNARVHTSRKVKSFLSAADWETIPQPPYSPDLAPCDFYLFGTVKYQLEGMYARNRDEMVEKTKKIFGKIPKEQFKIVMSEWKRRLKKCIEFEGEYTENLP